MKRLPLLLLLLLLLSGSAPAQQIRWYALPTTNRIALTNWIMVGIDGSTNGLKAIRWDNIISNFTMIDVFSSGGDSSVFFRSGFADDNDTTLRLASSDDGVHWKCLDTNCAGLFTTPFVTGFDVVRDPSITIYSNLLYCAYTSQVLDPLDYFSLAVSSDGLSWTFQQHITNTVSHGANSIWAPEWFMDGSFVRLYWSRGDNGNQTGIWETHALNGTLTSWSPASPVLTNGPYIDPSLIKIGSTYYLFYRDINSNYIHRASSSSPTNGFIIDKTGNWAGWGQNLEAPNIIAVSTNRWRLYVENFNEYKYYFSESTDLNSWTPLTQIEEQFKLRHGTVFPLWRTNTPHRAVPVSDNRSVFVRTSVELSNAVRNLTNGTKIVLDSGIFDAPAMDWLVPSLGITNKHDWEIEGQGASTVVRSTKLGSIIGVSSCSNWAFRKFAVVGLRTNGLASSSAGILVGGTNLNGVFDRMLIISNNDQGIIIQNDPVGHYSQNISYLNCFLEYNGSTNFNGLPYDGAACYICDGALVQGCTFRYNVRDIEGYGTLPYKGVRIFGNRFEATVTQTIIFLMDADDVGASDLQIVANDFHLQRTNIVPSGGSSFNARALHIGSATNLTFANNIVCCGDVGVNIGYNDNGDGHIYGLTIENNSVEDMSQDAFSLVRDPAVQKRIQSFKVVNNHANRIGRNGIWIAGGQDGIVEANTFGDVGTTSVGACIKVGGADFYKATTNISFARNIFSASATTATNIILSTNAYSCIVADNNVRNSLPPAHDTGVGTIWYESQNLKPVTIAGTGTGNTNFTLQANQGQMYLTSSSNVNIVAIMSTLAGVIRSWTCTVTNLSAADTWGFRISPTTNNVRYSHPLYGTNAPILSNNTRVVIHGVSEGTNTTVTYEHYRPAL